MSTVMASLSAEQPLTPNNLAKPSRFKAGSQYLGYDKLRDAVTQSSETSDENRYQDIWRDDVTERTKRSAHGRRPLVGKVVFCGYVYFLAVSR